MPRQVVYADPVGVILVSCVLCGHVDGLRGGGFDSDPQTRGVKSGPRLLGTLRDLHAVVSEHGNTHGCLIFPGVAGRPRDRGDVSKRLHRDALRQTIRLHDLRHSAAVAWIAAGLLLTRSANSDTARSSRPSRTTATWPSRSSATQRRRSRRSPPHA